LLAAMVLLAALAFVLLRPGLRQPFRFLVALAYSGGIASGAPVKLAGVQVGRVAALQLSPAARDRAGASLPVRLAVEVEQPAGRALRADAEAFVGTKGPLGEPYLELTVVEPGGSADRGTARFWQTGAAQKGVQDSAALVEELRREVPPLLADVRAVTSELAQAKVGKSDVERVRAALAPLRRAGRAVAGADHAPRRRAPARAGGAGDHRRALSRPQGLRRPARVARRSEEASLEDALEGLISAQRAGHLLAGPAPASYRPVVL